MKYSVLGDVHANLEALEAVLKDAGRHKPDQYVSTGDIVGYNASPVECMNRMKKISATTVQGNHDCYAAGEENLEWFNPAAAAAIRWTRNQLDTEYRHRLATLPMTLQVADFTLVHGSLCAPKEWEYILRSKEASASLNVQEAALCFNGHSHRPIFFRMKGEVVEYGLYETLELEAGWKYLVNAGSVGQPRDGDPRAAYVIYDDQKRTVSLHRVTYDIRATQAKIRSAGLPEKDAVRLSAGR